MALITISSVSSSSSSLSRFPLSRNLPPNPPSSLPVSTHTRATFSSTHPNSIVISKRRTTRRWSVSSSDNQTVEEVKSSTGDSPAAASEVVRNFYGGINRRDLDSVKDLIARDCVYEDLIFSQPFVGRKAILEFFQKFNDSISADLQFVIDDISNEDSSAVGVTWHLDWKGKPFPFSKGCSFYKLDVFNGKRQIIYARDCVEPATKPGEVALVAIRGVTWLLQRFPQLVDRF